MKKVLIWIGIVLLIWFAGYGFFHYRQQQSYEQFIARQSSGLLRINVDKLLRGMAWNAVLNPLYYFKDTKKDTGKVIKPWETGLKIPANLFLYTINNYQQTTFFTRLKIGDFERFKRFSENTWRIEHTKADASGISTAVGWDGRLSLAYTDTYVALCFSPSKEHVFPALLDLLDSKSLLEVKQTTFLEHVKGSEQAIYWSDSMAMTLKFTNGALYVNGNLKTSLINAADSLVPRMFDENSLIKMWLAADIIPLIKWHRNSLEKHRIPVDTLINYYGSYLDVEWKNQQLVQTDTVITYDYDADFNRVEQKTICKEEVPEIYVGLEASPHLANYLPAHMGYKFYHGMRQNRLYFGTGTDFPEENERDTTKQFFYLFVDVKKLKQQKDLLRFGHYFPKLITITCTANKEINREIHFESKLNFSNKSVNSLVQLLKQ